MLCQIFFITVSLDAHLGMPNVSQHFVTHLNVQNLCVCKAIYRNVPQIQQMRGNEKKTDTGQTTARIYIVQTKN